MQYRVLGKTGLRVSALGFGTMRFQMDGDNVDEEVAIAALHRAMDLGVNYFDSAVGYCNSQSEAVLGKALVGRRQGLVISTKYPTWQPYTCTAEDCRRILEQSLSRLGLDSLDVYHMHSLDWSAAQRVLAPGGALDGARKAKEEGLVKHLAFSFHDEAKRMIDIIDAADDFESVTCQYNLLDRSNEASIAYAHEKGLGVVIMGPVGGGRLGFPSEQLMRMVPGGVKSTPEIALRFVLANPNVTVALSGMNSVAMVEENAATASREEPLSEEERQRVLEALAENRRLAELYCTGCGYCMPCPNGVNIPENFRLMNLHRVYGLTQVARQRYARFGPKEENNLNASACVECGTCEPKCPQKIPIIEQLKETHRELGDE
jgi:predicted aldo/keto reductase-like oxidoreductase